MISSGMTSAHASSARGMIGSRTTTPTTTKAKQADRKQGGDRSSGPIAAAIAAAARLGRRPCAGPRR